MDISPELSAALTTIAIFALQAIGKKIPDDATGVTGIVRRIIKCVTAYVENNTGKIRQKSTGPTPPPGGKKGGG